MGMWCGAIRSETKLSMCGYKRSRHLSTPAHPPTPQSNCSARQIAAHPRRSFYDHDFGMLPGTSLPRLVRPALLAYLTARQWGSTRHSSQHKDSILLLFLAQVDMGQCNDAYSAIVVASKLAEVRAGAGRGGVPT